MTANEPAIANKKAGNQLRFGQHLLDRLSALMFSVRRQSTLSRIILALVFVLIAALTRQALGPHISDRPTYIPFHAAVVLAAVLGGPAACAVATISSLLITHVVFQSSRGPSDVIALATFAMTAFLLSGLIEWLIKTQRRMSLAEELHHRDAHWHLFIEQAPVAIAMFDREMRYLAASRRWLQDYQIDDVDVVGRSHYDVFPNLPHEFHSIHERALAGETLRSDCDSQIVLSNGQSRWERWEIRPWLSSQGEIGGVAIFSEDVGSQRSLRESKDNLKRAQAVAKLGNWRMNFAANELNGSRQTFELLGQPPDARLDYDHLLAIVNEVDRNRVNSARRSVLQSQSYDIEYRFQLNDHERWMREQCGPEYDASGKVVGGFGVIQDITEQKIIEINLAASEERLRLALDAAGMAVWDLDLRTGVDVWNDQSYRMIGYEPGEVPPGFETWSRHVHPDDRATVTNRFMESLSHGTDLVNENRMIDRQGNIRWVSVRGRTAHDELGRPTRSFGVITDITEQKQAEERDRLLSAEVNHRAKNLLAVVQAVALQTARHCQPDQFSKKFDNRLRSLSASHDLLVNSKWHSVNIRDLVLSQLSHFHDLINDRIVCSDTNAKLNSNAAQAIGLALHELITNAAKYGALSTSDGSISITWAIEGSATEPRFKILWQEKGGPPVTQPIRQGFGHSVLLQMAPYSLGATVDLSFPPEGLKWHLDAPAALVLKPEPHAAG